MILARYNWINATIFSAVLGLSCPAACADDSDQGAAGAQATSTAALSKDSIAARIRDGDLSASPLFLPTAERRVVFANIEYFSPVRGVVPDETLYTLERDLQDFSALTYTVGDETFTLDEFLAQSSLMGLMVVSDDRIALEHYAQDHGPSSRWITFSVTKSVTSLLIGAALEDGFIGSLEDKVTDYLPRLRGSAYDEVSILNLLNMASGVAWNEDYTDPESDVSIAGTFNGVALTDHLKKLPREHPPGEVFNYNTGESNLTGEVLRAAIGNNASSYLTAKIWQPFGMQADATWLTNTLNGSETGGCCISATLEDYSRIGLFALNDGVLPNGDRVLPEGWMQASTEPFAGNENYGYLWWLYPDGRYSASGIFGQKIFVDPASRTVIAVHSNAETATGSAYAEHLNAALLAISEHMRAGDGS